MKAFLCFFILYSLSIVAHANSLRMLSTTQRAIFSYKSVRLGAKKFTDKLASEAFGEYQDQAAIILVPLVYGEISYNLDSTMFYYNFRDTKIGLKYSYRF